jgi:hypothetical protein
VEARIAVRDGVKVPSVPVPAAAAKPKQQLSLGEALAGKGAPQGFSIAAQHGGVD